MLTPTSPSRSHRQQAVATAALVLAALAVAGALAGPAAATTSSASGQAGAAAVSAAGPADATDTTTPPEDGANVSVVVGFHDRPRPAVVRQLGGEVTTTFDLIPAVEATVPASAVVALQRREAVEYVEHDRRLSLRNGSVDAPLEATVNETVPWGISRVGAPAVHADGTDGEGVIVGVIDSGVDRDHPELADSYGGGVDLVNGDGTPEDGTGHGTHVAGTVVAADDDDGVVGVAPGATFYGVKVLNETGEGTLSDIIAGVEWAVQGPDGEVGTDDDADVITMSIGGFVGPESLRKVLEAAYEDHDVVVVAAAGNVGELDYPDTVMFPARFAEVISVGAVDRQGNRPPWSGAGPRLELAAPGVDVLSTAVGGGVVRGEGTSFAAPHVAGVAALVLASEIPRGADDDGDGEWDAPEVRERLRDTARDLGGEGRDDSYGYGVVDAAAAVGAPAGNERPTLTVRSPVAGSTVDGAVVVLADATDDRTPPAELRVAFRVGGGEWRPLDHLEGDTFAVAEVVGPLPPGLHVLEVRAVDGDGASTVRRVIVRGVGENGTAGEGNR